MIYACLLLKRWRVRCGARGEFAQVHDARRARSSRSASRARPCRTFPSRHSPLGARACGKDAPKCFATGLRLLSGSLPLTDARTGFRPVDANDVGGRRTGEPVRDRAAQDGTAHVSTVKERRPKRDFKPTLGNCPPESSLSTPICGGRFAPVATPSTNDGTPHRLSSGFLSG